MSECFRNQPFSLAAFRFSGTFSSCSVSSFCVPTDGVAPQTGHGQENSVSLSGLSCVACSCLQRDNPPAGLLLPEGTVCRDSRGSFPESVPGSPGCTSGPANPQTCGDPGHPIRNLPVPRNQDSPVRRGVQHG